MALFLHSCRNRENPWGFYAFWTHAVKIGFPLSGESVCGAEILFSRKNDRRNMDFG
jgi:hypothetical protein